MYPFTLSLVHVFFAAFPRVARELQRDCSGRVRLLIKERNTWGLLCLSFVFLTPFLLYNCMQFFFFMSLPLNVFHCVSFSDMILSSLLSNVLNNLPWGQPIHGAISSCINSCMKQVQFNATNALTHNCLALLLQCYLCSTISAHAFIQLSIVFFLSWSFDGS